MSINAPKENPELRARLLKQLQLYADSPELPDVDLEKTADFFTEKAEEHGMKEPVITLEEVGIGQSNIFRKEVGRDKQFVLRDEFNPKRKELEAVRAGEIMDQYKDIDLMTEKEYLALAKATKNKVARVVSWNEKPEKPGFRASLRVDPDHKDEK